MGYTVIGHCPQCGAPIYGESPWFATTPPPSIFSCNCRPQDYIKTYTTSSTSLNISDCVKTTLNTSEVEDS